MKTSCQYLSVFVAFSLVSAFSYAQILEGSIWQSGTSVGVGYSPCGFNDIQVIFDNPLDGESIQLSLAGSIPCYDENYGLYIDGAGFVFSQVYGQHDLRFAFITREGLDHNGNPNMHSVWRSFEENETIGADTDFENGNAAVAIAGYWPYETEPYTPHTGWSNEFYSSGVDDSPLLFCGFRLEVGNDYHYGYGGLKILGSAPWTIEFQSLYIQSAPNTPIMAQIDPFACPTDISGDGVTDVDDFIMFNSAFGTSCSGCVEDMNGDGQVDVNDFLVLNSVFGETCN